MKGSDALGVARTRARTRARVRAQTRPPTDRIPRAGGGALWSRAAVRRATRRLIHSYSYILDAATVNTQLEPQMQPQPFGCIGEYTATATDAATDVWRLVVDTPTVNTQQITQLQPEMQLAPCGRGRRCGGRREG